ncbi:MAG TPA: lipopolysaccharide kinase InaA family protein [Gemmatimonadota bacterium]|nr:lipopolysaccharide kinase InaA family protein [Gemmatimonadota bacterium]
MVAAEPVAGAVRAALEAAPSLVAWAAARAELSQPGGRGAVYLARLAGRRVAVRHARRGGWMRWLGDRYLDRPPRPFREVAVSARLRAAGVATPEVLAAVVTPARPGYRADLATEWIEPGHDLRALLAPNVYPAEARRAGLEAAGREVGRAHRAGLDHPDLNVGNLFLEPADPGWRAWLLDLDRATIGRRSPDTPSRNVARLVRSLEKERRAGAIAWDAEDLDVFRRAHRAGLENG